MLADTVSESPRAFRLLAVDPDQSITVPIAMFPRSQEFPPQMNRRVNHSSKASPVDVGPSVAHPIRVRWAVNSDAQQLDTSLVSRPPDAKKHNTTSLRWMAPKA
jgi:hypothetical protein